MKENTYAVTLVKAGAGIPLIEVGAYRYTGEQLPRVGDTIPIRPVAAPGELHGYVTRIRPASENPISVVEVSVESSTEDLIKSDDELAA
jgi:hypothetical protein